MSDPQPAPPRQGIAGILLGLGGLLLLVSVFLTWGTRTVFLSEESEATGNGLDVTPDGWFVLAAAVLVLIAALVLASGPGAGLRRTLALAAVVAGLAAVVIGVYDIVRLEDRVLEELATTQAREQQVPFEEAREALGRGVEVKPGPGLLGVVAGGVLPALGGVLAMRTPKGPQRAPAPPPVPPATGPA
jgi:tryptophan-associated transmembrane protein